MTGDAANRFAGAILGLALGDAFGAPYEGSILERALWACIGTTRGKRRWTDDTQMSLDLTESLLEFGCINGDDLAQRFCRSYRWDRGYGPGTVRVLKRIRRGVSWETAAKSVFHGGSYGNGGAMRAPIIGLYFAAVGADEIAHAARASAAVTHFHPLALEGAELVALTTAWAFLGKDVLETIDVLTKHCSSTEFGKRLALIAEWLRQPEPPAPAAIRLRLGNSTAAVESCVTAICIALAYRERSFDDLLAAAISVGGDVDTIAAMAGAIWGACRGADALPQAKLDRLEQYDRISKLAVALATAAN